MSIYYEIFRGGIVTEALLLCHTLEKGMGIKNVKYGYGKEKAIRLTELIQMLSEQEKENEYIYVESYSVLQAYLEYQKKKGVDISEINAVFEKLKKPFSLLPAGFEMISKETFLKGITCNFDKLILSRHSLRNYSDQPITREEMCTIINLSIKAPSACNRQPWKVYYSMDNTKNQTLSKLVPGNKGFESDIPYYCVITVDRKMFGGNEIYQWYLNGGIFISYFMLALHANGIGSCIFQYPDFFKSYKEIQKLLKLKKSEVIIAIIGYGKYPEEAKCIQACRKSVNEVAIEF